MSNSSSYSAESFLGLMESITVMFFVHSIFPQPLTSHVNNGIYSVAFVDFVFPC